MALLTLYQRGFGSSQYSVPQEPPVLNQKEWETIRGSVIQLMRARGQESAATVLRDYDFQIYKGDNDWKDEFNVLYHKISMDQYIVFASPGYYEKLKEACSQIANTFAELGQPVRFVGAEYIPDVSPQPVAAPSPTITSITVQSALDDAEHMVEQKRPVSAVDRAHTALHGYLKQVCGEAKLSIQTQDPSLTEVIKNLIKQHPKLANLGPHKDQVEKILKAMSVTCDALNPIRNHGSLAHANESLLEPAEAMLAINASRTLLHYVDQKLK